MSHDPKEFKREESWSQFIQGWGPIIITLLTIVYTYGMTSADMKNLSTSVVDLKVTMSKMFDRFDVKISEHSDRLTRLESRDRRHD